MIVTVKPLKPSIIENKLSFEEIKCILNPEKKNVSSILTKPVFFLRYIGMDHDEDGYMHQLKDLDKSLQSSEGKYMLFTKGLENVTDMHAIEKMKKIMDTYMNLENQKPSSPNQLFNFHMGYAIKNECLEWTKKLAFKEILKLYDENHPHKNETIRKNFGVKILLWMNKYLKEIFENQFSIDVTHKILFYGPIKKHEWYFLILLWKLGCHILYINPKEDIEKEIHEVKEYSSVIRCRQMHNTLIPFPENTMRETIKYPSKIKTVKEKEEVKTQNIRKREDIHVSIARQINIDSSRKNIQTEKSYEEIAKLAESVVLINVYDEKQKLVGGGSGVAISHNGFILTNFHVVGRGVVFGVVFENDNNEYLAYNIVKYHPDYDLALIKVDKTTKPIQLNERDLVRGQKIVTIGSPLGLFNTISDGIVSGFREFERTKMIQITAPISPGSSGGALIDMYGNLVGITTSGLEGQNLNMAVPAQYIKIFAGNILNA